MKHLGGPVRRALVPVLALVSAFLLGAVLIALTDVEQLERLGGDPLGAIGGMVAGVLDGYRAMFAGALGDPGRIVEAIRSGRQSEIGTAIRPITETLLVAAPFIFVGLGLAVSFHAGLFNLGAGGQFLIGSLGATMTAVVLESALPPLLVLMAALAGGALFGAGFGFVPGFLKARAGAHEVITTLMLNAIAPNIVLFVSSSIDFRSLASIPRIPLIFDLPTVRLDYGIVAAVVMAGVLWFVLFRTTLGFELRATGFSRSVARGAGMGPVKTTILAMSLSGGLIGLGSAFFALGPAGGVTGGPTFGMGYVAVALVLIAGLRPVGIVLIAILYGALNTGAKNMVVATGVPLTLLVAIIAFALMFVAAPDLVRSIWRLRPPPAPGDSAPLDATALADAPL